MPSSVSANAHTLPIERTAARHRIAERSIRLFFFIKNPPCRFVALNLPRFSSFMHSWPDSEKIIERLCEQERRRADPAPNNAMQAGKEMAPRTKNVFVCGGNVKIR